MVLQFVGEYVVAFLWNPSLNRLGFFFFIEIAIAIDFAIAIDIDIYITIFTAILFPSFHPLLHRGLG